MSEMTSETKSKKKSNNTPDPYRYVKKAEQFIEYLNERGHRPVYHNGKFMAYDLNRYVEEAELNHKIRTFCQQRHIAQSNQLIGNVAPIVQNLAIEPKLKGRQLPCYVGKDRSFPDPQHIIAFRNGLFDLAAYAETGVGRPLIGHTSDFLSDVCLPYDFDPEATCPHWNNFLSEVFDDDEGRIELLQQWFGYCLTADTSQQKMMFLCGVAGGGKGTILYVLQKAVGDAYTTGFNANALALQFGLGQLAGKRLAICGELELAKNLKRMAVNQLLAIIGEDEVSIEYKHNPLFYSVRLPVKFVVACNGMPAFNDSFSALRRRSLLLTFERAFGGTSQENPSLRNELVKELPGIANWGLKGYRSLSKAGRFTMPQNMVDTLHDHQREHSPILGFLEDELVVEQSIDPGNLQGVAVVRPERPLALSLSSAESAYFEWARVNNKNVDTSWFTRNLKQVLPKLKVGRAQSGGVRERHLFGVDLRAKHLRLLGGESQAA